MKCEECGEEVEGDVCKNCGLVYEDHPIEHGRKSVQPRKWDITTLHSADIRVWEHPLSPKIRKRSRAFKPRYQKKYTDYVYIKAYEAISKLCGQLRVPNNIKYEALNLFRDIRRLDEDFFRSYKLAPTYLACIKIACRILDFPITNQDLAEVIDYKIANDSNNLAYMEKKFNKAYSAILRLYRLNIPTPEHPHYIDYACELLGLPYEFTAKIHKRYIAISRYMQPHYKMEGYILALIYIYGRDEYELYLSTLQEKFNISSITLSKRKNELLKCLKLK